MWGGRIILSLLSGNRAGCWLGFLAQLMVLDPTLLMSFVAWDWHILETLFLHTCLSLQCALATWSQDKWSDGEDFHCNCLKLIKWLSQLSLKLFLWHFKEGVQSAHECWVGISKWLLLKVTILSTSLVSIFHLLFCSMWSPLTPKSFFWIWTLSPLCCRRNLNYFSNAYAAAVSAVDPDAGNGELCIKVPSELWKHVDGKVQKPLKWKCYRLASNLE